jgi:putative membrane protein
MLSTLLAHCYGAGDGWGPGPWVFFPFFLLALLVLGFVAFRAGRFGRFGRFGPPGAHDARSLLAARYARGEMDEDEYRRRLGVLEETGR